MKVVCIYCGNEYEETIGYCPICAEPYRKEKDMEDEIRELRNKRYHGMYVIFSVMMLFPILVGFLFHIVIGILVSICMLYINFLLRKRIDELKGKDIEVTREKIIEVQYAKDDTSICPRCGSHSIHISRKINANYGFYVDGGYMGFKDPDELLCTCEYCGKSWKSKQTI